MLFPFRSVDFSCFPAYNQAILRKGLLKKLKISTLAKRAKALNLDAIHEMSWDKARHGKALKGLLERHFTQAVMMKTSMELVWMSGGFALLFLGVGIWNLLRWHLRKAHCTRRIEGIIERTRCHTFEDSTPTYTTTIAFEVDGRTYRLTETFDMAFGHEGKIAYVWVDPNKPSRSRLDTNEIRIYKGSSSPGYSWLFIVLGVLSCVFALLMYFAPQQLQDFLHLPGDLLRRLKAR